MWHTWLYIYLCTCSTCDAYTSVCPESTHCLPNTILVMRLAKDQWNWASKLVTNLMGLTMIHGHGQDSWTFINNAFLLRTALRKAHDHMACLSIDIITSRCYQYPFVKTYSNIFILICTVDPPVVEIHTLIPPSYMCKFMPLLVSTSTEYNTQREWIQSTEGINFIPEWCIY